MTDLSDTLITRLEEAEVDAWADVCEADAIRTDGLGWASWRTDDATIFYAARSDVLFHNRVHGLWTDSIDPEGIERVIDIYRAARVSSFLVNVPPAAEKNGLPDALADRGFVPHDRWLKLYRTVDDPPPEARDVHVTRIPSRLAPAFGLELVRTFGWPLRLAETIAAIPRRPGWKVYVAWLDDEPAAFGAMFVDGGSAYTGPSLTRPEHRNRGAQTALIAHRIREAARHGCALMIAETEDPSPDQPNTAAQNLLRSGFQIAYRRPNWRMDLANR